MGMLGREMPQATSSVDLDELSNLLRTRPRLAPALVEGDRGRGKLPKIEPGRPLRLKILSEPRVVPGRNHELLGQERDVGYVF